MKVAVRLGCQEKDVFHHFYSGLIFVCKFIIQECKDGRPPGRSS